MLSSTYASVETQPIHITLGSLPLCLNIHRQETTTGKIWYWQDLALSLQELHTMFHLCVKTYHQLMISGLVSLLGKPYNDPQSAIFEAARYEQEQTLESCPRSLPAQPHVSELNCVENVATVSQKNLRLAVFIFSSFRATSFWRKRSWRTLICS